MKETCERCRGQKGILCTFYSTFYETISKAIQKIKSFEMRHAATIVENWLFLQGIPL